uniref:Uncharacterized protein n=1 Tax=Siphoviridae sp. ctgaY24 TaxID=2827911 RepID=A0A8S5SBH0_9CAUD|nr:MAG TPA: hypothetical protein [Siphoviridae sp. ctgaY24]
MCKLSINTPLFVILFVTTYKYFIVVIIQLSHYI